MSGQTPEPRPVSVALMMLLGGKSRAEVTRYLWSATIREAAESLAR